MPSDTNFEQVRAPGLAEREGVADYFAPTAKELLEQLSPRSSVWGEDPTAWVFRGQANADWELKARALREKSNPFRAYGVLDMPRDAAHRRRLEKGLIERFARSLDEQGLYRPPDERSVRALAQHHGLPTILLDWSRRAYVGAYFAAYWALKEAVDPGPYISVWALHLNEGGYTPQLSILRPPASTNPNLRAQSGLFTEPPPVMSDPSLEHFMARIMYTRPGPRHPLMRFALPREEAPTLLRLLSYEGITGASMYPRTDGVVRAIEEISLWDKPVKLEEVFS